MTAHYPITAPAESFHGAKITLEPQGFSWSKGIDHGGGFETIEECHADIEDTYRPAKYEDHESSNVMDRAWWRGG